MPGRAAMIRTYFDGLALEYVLEREQQHSFRSQRDIVLRMLGDGPGRVADIGCGPAVMAAALLERGWQVHGVDAAPQMIQHGRARLAGHPSAARVELEVGDIEALGLPDASFDAAICMGVLEYLETHGRALREIHRILRPGGVAVISVPNRASQYRAGRTLYNGARDALRALAGKPSAAWPDPAISRCTPRELDGELAAAGLRKAESRPCNFMLFPLQEMHSGAALAANRCLTAFGARLPLPVWLGAQYVVKAEKPA